MKHIYLILIIPLFFSCIDNVEKNIIIKDFSYSFLDSLQPNSRMQKKGYISYNVEIKGYINDTLIIYFSNVEKKPLYLSGKINERYWEEYLGKTKKYIKIEPYKATKGELNIKYGLYK